MQFAMPGGLKSGVGTPNERFRIVCTQNAEKGIDDKRLIQMWAARTPQQAHDFLAKPDVQVTNQSDKEGQLPKIAKLGSTVKEAFDKVAQRQRATVALCEETVQRRKASLAAWEAENGTTAGPNNPAKRAVVEWEQQLAAARQADRMHGMAIKEGLMPMAMEREVETVWGCVPKNKYYILPACLHLCLCPQQGCDPQCEGDACIHHLNAIGTLECVQAKDKKFAPEGAYCVHADGFRPWVCCWEYRWYRKRKNMCGCDV